MKKYHFQKGIVTLILSFALILTFFFQGTSYTKAEDSFVAFYFIDNTSEGWMKNDEAIIELVDNTSGHDPYIMTKDSDTQWSAKVPSSAYNITFNRKDPSGDTQWNSWSAGGRDGNNAYYADGAEYGHWDKITEDDDKKHCFQAGDIVYLDFTSFMEWKNDGASFYINFTDASKEENSGADISLFNADSLLYRPEKVDREVKDCFFKYVLGKADDGAESLRFWRGNENALWNCSDVLTFGDYQSGNNCVRITGWEESENYAAAGYETEINIETGAFEYNAAADWYFADGEVTSLSGTLSAAEGVIDMTYEVADIKGNVIKSGEIKPGFSWCIDDFGLVTGYNIVRIHAEMLVGKDVIKEIKFINLDVSNIANTDADMSDNDGDGLPNYYEEIYDTDKDISDTDGDGLNDFNELITIGTDPLIIDTDGNGIFDSEEILPQTFSEEIEDAESPGVLKVTVNTECSGYLDDRVSITDTFGLDNRSSDVVGLFGVPIEIGYDGEIDSATITFTYDGDVWYDSSIVSRAVSLGVKIYCINVVSGSSSAMERYASETGGTYYYASTSDKLAEVISELKGETIDYVDPTDTDGDGLYDVYEINGMRLSNGRIVYTDPNKSDTDGDGISDYDAMGGGSIIEKYVIGSNKYSVTMNH